jgi:hypothetical protein
MRLLRPLLAGLACAALLAGCGGGTTTVVKTDTSAAHPKSTAAPAATTGSTSPTTTAGSPSGGTSSAGEAGACTAADLKLAYLGGLGATGHGEIGLGLINTSAQPCHTFGYPGVQFLSGSGAALPTRVTRTTHDFFGSIPEQALTVSPGSEVSFRLTTTHGEGSDSGCTTAAKIQVIPPDDTHTLVATIENGAYECGAVTVSPLAPRTSAFS